MDTLRLDRRTYRLLERQMQATVKLAREVERLNDHLEQLNEIDGAASDDEIDDRDGDDRQE